MSCFLSIACPRIDVLVRREFLHDMDTQYAGDYERGRLNRAIVRVGRALCFTVMLDNGALFYELPVHALCTKPCEPLPLHVLELWNCLSFHAAVYEDPWRAGLDVQVKLGDGGIASGTCLFSVDYVHADPQILDAGWSMQPHEHKEHHVIELGSGHIAAQPANRIIWLDSSYVAKPIDLRTERPKYKTNTRVWSVEGRRRSDDSNDLFYEVETETCEPTKQQQPT